MKHNTYKLKALYHVIQNIKKKDYLKFIFSPTTRDTYYSKALYFVVIIFLVFIFLIHTQRRSKTKVNNNVFTEAEEVC